MSSKVFRDAVDTFLTDNWVATEILGLENDITELPNTLDPWLSYGFRPFQEAIRAIGSPSNQCFRETGLLSLNTWVASGTGSDVALGYAEDLRTLFRRASLGEGIRILTVAPPEVGIPSQSQSSAGNWFAYQVDAEYTYDYQA